MDQIATGLVQLKNCGIGIAHGVRHSAAVATPWHWGLAMLSKSNNRLVVLKFTLITEGLVHPIPATHPFLSEHQKQIQPAFGGLFVLRYLADEWSWGAKPTPAFCTC